MATLCSMLEGKIYHNEWDLKMQDAQGSLDNMSSRNTHAPDCLEMLFLKKSKKFIKSFILKKKDREIRNQSSSSLVRTWDSDLGQIFYISGSEILHFQNKGVALNSKVSPYSKIIHLTSIGECPYAKEWLNATKQRVSLLLFGTLWASSKNENISIVNLRRLLCHILV